jgi:hypothetical protein
MGSVCATTDINAPINPIEDCMDDMGDVMDHVVALFGAEKEAETDEDCSVYNHCIYTRSSKKMPQPT